jgi:hypothetical protein
MLIYRLYQYGLESLAAECETLFGSKEQISRRQALTALGTLATNLILGLWYATFILGPALAKAGEKPGVFDGVALTFAIFGVAWIVGTAAIMLLHRTGLAVIWATKKLRGAV